jgi:hypothetical protein
MADIVNIGRYLVTGCLNIGGAKGRTGEMDHRPVAGNITVVIDRIVIVVNVIVGVVVVNVIVVYGVVIVVIIIVVIVIGGRARMIAPSQIEPEENV